MTKKDIKYTSGIWRINELNFCNKIFGKHFIKTDDSNFLLALN